MDLGPKIRGRKIKSIRVDPSDLKLLRKELKANPEWAQYAEASDSEVHRIAVIVARIHIAPDIYVLTLDAINQLVDEAVRNAIGGVALALGGVAQMNPDKTISVTRPGQDTIETLEANPVQPRRKPMIQ